MPIKQNNKKGSSSHGAKNTGTFFGAGLYIVNDDGKIVNEGDPGIYGTFLLNPTSFEDSKNASWIQHNIPGQSDPVVQWVSSGARSITFDALVTNDKSNLDKSESQNTEKSSAPSSIKNYFADIAGSLASVKSENIRPSGQVPRPTLDITPYLNYYRSLLYPKYEGEGDARRLSKGPPRLVLLAGKTISNSIHGFGTTIKSKDETWVLTDLKVKTTKMLPNLSPMEAIVSFTLVQYNKQSSSSEDIFSKESTNG